MKSTPSLKMRPFIVSVVRHIRHDWLYFCAVNRRLFKKEDFLKYFAFSYGLYFIGIFGIILADVYYRDDWKRSQTGHLGFDEEASSRIASEYLLRFFGGWDYETRIVADASPLFQLIAIGILAFGSVCLVKLVANNLSYLRVVAALPLGLSPYFLVNLSYKYDSLPMALSVVATIVPFLYLRRLSIFLFVSFVSILIMMTTYQASNGIYPLIVFFLFTKSLGGGGKSSIATIKWRVFIVYTVVVYIVSLFFFKEFVQVKDGLTTSYRSGQIFDTNILAIVGTLKRNLLLYVEYIKTDLSGTLFAKLSIIVSLMFVVFFTFTSKRHKGGALILSVLFIKIGFFMSYGLFLFLKEPFFRERAFCGFGVFFALLLITLATSRHVVNRVVVCLFSYNLVVLSYVYANALSEQYHFFTHRMHAILTDFTKVAPPKLGMVDIYIRSKGERMSPVYKTSENYFPLLKRSHSFLEVNNMFWMNWQSKSVLPWGRIVIHRGGGECRGEQIAAHESTITLIKRFPNGCYEFYFK